MSGHLRCKGDLLKVDQECALDLGDGFSRRDPGQDLVCNTNDSELSGNEGSNMGHVNDQSGLLQEYAFTGVIRTCQDQHARGVFPRVGRMLALFV